jgi:hypothetical protein
MRFSEERKWRKSKVAGWNLKLFEYLRSSPIFYFLFMSQPGVAYALKKGEKIVKDNGFQMMG